MKHKYGSFIGDADPIEGDTSNQATPWMLIEFAEDRVEDELLDKEQTIGVLRYAQDSIHKLMKRVQELENMIPQGDLYIVRHSPVNGYELFDRVERRVLFNSNDRVMVMDEALKMNGQSKS